MTSANPRPWSTQYQEDFNAKRSKGYSTRKKPADSNRKNNPHPPDSNRKNNPHPPEGFVDKQRTESIREEVRKAFRECMMAERDKQKTGNLNAQNVPNAGMWCPGQSVPSTMPVTWDPAQSVPPPVPLAWNMDTNTQSHIPPTYVAGHHQSTNDDAMRQLIDPVMQMIKKAKENKMREHAHHRSRTPKFNSNGYLCGRDDEPPKRTYRSVDKDNKTKENINRRPESPPKTDQKDRSKQLPDRPLSKAGNCAERPKTSLDKPNYPGGPKSSVDKPNNYQERPKSSVDKLNNYPERPKSSLDKPYYGPDVLHVDSDDIDKEDEENTDDELEIIARVPSPPPREPSPAPPKEPKDYHWSVWPEPDWEDKKKRPHTSLGINRAPSPMGPGDDLEDRPDSCQPSYTFGDSEEITKGSPMTFVPQLKSWINTSSDYDMDVAYNMMKHLNRGKSASRPRSTTMYVNGRPVRPVQRSLDLNSNNPYLQAWVPYSYEEKKDPYLDLYRSQSARPSVRHRIRYAPSNEYVHQNSMFSTTTPNCSGHFVIHPDWVSEKMGLRRAKTTMTKTSRHGLRY